MHHFRSQSTAANYFALAWIALLIHVASGSAEEVDERASEKSHYFENKIRPVLIKHCLECHSTTTEASGGLLLDSLAGWQAGGDSGPSIIPGNTVDSRLLKAIVYDDSKLQMPPKGKLPQEVIDAFTKWIADGAYDPRVGLIATKSTAAGLTVERAQDHWAYRSLPKMDLPPDSIAPQYHRIDDIVDARLALEGIEPAATASQVALVRRLYFDLTGLPPSGGELRSLVGQDGKGELDYESLVERLLMSPQFGENFARKWMDVARYAESVTLRGFVLPEAWRYRDYLVQAYSEDRPFDQMIREQIAGDLLKNDDLRERQMQLVATGFLALGNTNLEEQDKTQLEMDYIDEQLDVIGGAFLGQTIGCARCHNHKFDPIPTRDYYAMAGILRSSVALEHENVSKWIEQPLPVPNDEEAKYLKITEELESIKNRLSSFSKSTKKSGAAKKGAISVAELPGVVVDSSDSKQVGIWTISSAVGPVVGDGYIHDGNSDKGKKTATFEPPSLTPGTYEVRLSYSASDNRASNTRVRIFSADGEATVVINQKQSPPEDGIWVSLGKYRFEKDGQAFVLVTNDQSDGVVIVDAVQFLPLGADSKTSGEAKLRDPDADEFAAKATARREKELKQLEGQRKQLETQLGKRPKYLTVIEKGPAVDIPIHIRGDVHNLGEIAPRGFLTAIATSRKSLIPADSSGRIELANWLSSNENPLTARVYANRVWSWLMGQGIVSTINNFGTTGTAPTHPELLDLLATELIRSNWSTKHLVRTIVLSDAYRRSVIEPSEIAQQVDPSNSLYWRGHMRKLTVESIRDAMLTVSGEIDLSVGGSLIRNNVKADYNYQHESQRRSLYQPLFRNSLPELFEAFDFADSSMSIGQRPRTTVATQALALLNNPWVAARAKAAAEKYLNLPSASDTSLLLNDLFWDCFGRLPTESEREACQTFLRNRDVRSDSMRLENVIHSLFTAIDFRYLE
jgi:hypothetical protein